MFYHALKRAIGADQRNRVIDNLLALRAQLDKSVPPKDAEHNLLLATWNIRDFDKKGAKHGRRMPESLFYIAEVISRFDIVAVQEINRLGLWHKVMGYLGPDWDYIATDVTDASLGGNEERLTYVFDKRKVHFRNIAGEIVLPRHLLISKAVVEDEETGTKVTGGKQFRRTPFVASFQAGWFSFDICTVHIYYGDESGDKLAQRIEEIDRVANFLAKRADIGLRKRRALIILGDFNIVSPEHKTMKALIKHGFKVPKNLRDKPTNIKGTNHFDQIAFKTDKDVLEYIETTASDPLKQNAGVFDLFGRLYRAEHFGDYKAEVKKTTKGKTLTGAKLEDYYLDEWRTYQFSDHVPMWVRIKSNDSENYLKKLKAS